MIDQLPFTRDYGKMNDHGFIYIPDACKEIECNFHIFLHGCGESAGADYEGFQIGSYVARATGILEHASANNMIVLFP